MDEQARPSGRDRAAESAGPGISLPAEAAALYADVRAVPLLRRLLLRSESLLHGAAGSVSLVERGGQRYHKVAEQGALCQLGHSFSLDEGVTGRVVSRRAPVVLERYADVAGAHLPDGHPARGGSVLAVPLWWRAEVIGVNVCFAGVRRTFTAAEVDDLETLTQLAVPGVVRSGVQHATESPARRPEPVEPRGSGPVAGAPAAAGSRSGPPAGSRSPLSDREREVALLLARGLRDRDIAAALVISPRTVEKHVAALQRKTGRPSRTAAVVHCVGEGWLPPV